MLRLLLTALLAGALAQTPSAVTANPYAAAWTVNGRVITNYDIEQRIALLEALGATDDVEELAVEQLTQDRLKILAGEELGIELPEDAAQIGLEEFAATRGLTPDDVINVLVERDIDRQTMDDFIMSNLVWREVVAARFRAKAMPSEADLDTAEEIRRNTPQELLTLGEIALPFAEHGEQGTIELADELYRSLSRGGDFTAAVRRYSRSGSAAQGGLLEPQPADRLPPALRTQVLLLQPGQVTRPVSIGGGLAILKLVSIRQAPPPAEGDAIEQEAAREALRQQLFAERLTSFGQGYLQELESDALIVVR